VEGRGFDFKTSHRAFEKVGFSRIRWLTGSSEERLLAACILDIGPFKVRLAKVHSVVIVGSVVESDHGAVIPRETNLNHDIPVPPKKEVVHILKPT
jgi:hypothetical protein